MKNFDFSGVQDGVWGLAGAAVLIAISALFSWLAANRSFGAKLKELKVSLDNDRKLAASQKLLDHTFQQLNDLYGPLLAIRKASKMLWEKLRSLYNSQHGFPVDQSFRLVDHLPAIKEDPTLKPYVDEILKLGERAAELLTTKGALVEGDWPESFKKYIGHVSIMRAAYDGGNPKAGEEASMQDSSFPRDLDSDIVRTHQILVEKKKKYLKLAEPTPDNHNTP